MNQDAVDLVFRPSLIMVLLFLLVLPAMACIRWALYSLPLSQPSFAWLRVGDKTGAALTMVGFGAVLLFATTLLANVVDGALESPKWQPLTLAFVLLITLAPAALGAYYSTSSDSNLWPASLRLHSDVAPASSAPALYRAARRVWFLALSQAAVVVLTISMCAFRLAIYDEKRDPTAIYTLLGLALAGILGIGIGSGVVAYSQNYASCLLLLNRIMMKQRGSESHSTATPEATLDPLGGTRSDLYELTRRIERISRRGTRKGLTYPLQHTLVASSTRIKGFLQSSRSMDRTIPPDLVTVIEGLGNLIVGDCGPDTYQQFALQVGAFDENGNPVAVAQPQRSRAGRLFTSMTQHAEPTDKLLSTAMKASALVLIIILAVSGKLGIEKIFEALK